ncbi:MAG: tRNA pseudouridine(55) synthase TruB [Lentisphaerae bacterium]|nr:tRNA pseudouridine(55) synthase TruB [Lentisphaerota bacterium]
MTRTYGQSGPARDPFDGILLVDKPAGMTSHDVVDSVRRRFRLQKVGHAGTLDPQCTGLLILLLGRGTKLAERLMGADKVYEGIMRLGIATDTQDAQGKVLREGDWSGVTEDALRAQMEKMQGDLMHTPPMVSAVKQGGVPLYKLARKGRTVERKAKLVHIYYFRLNSFEPPMASFDLKCTKGVYVRTLCSEIGDALGCGAHLAGLKRTRSGERLLADARPLGDILKMDVSALSEAVIPMNRVRE